MENPFGNIDWGRVSDWFSEQGVWLLVTLVVAALFYLALRRITPRVVRSILARIEVAPTGEEQQRLSRTVSRVVIWLGTVIIVAALVFALLPRFGVDLSPAGKAIGGWLGSNGVRIAIIVALAVAVHQIAKRLIRRVVERGVIRGKRRPREELRKRAETLSSFLNQVVVAVIWVMAAFMILSEIGVNIGPLLAGAGIVGIAIGFGAQSLIRDVLSGLFIIIENQYGKGDVVRIADIAGLVEEVNIRRTIMRDLDGIVHVVPNGEIRVASNFTREYSRVNLNISVGYGEDLDHAIQVINRVGREMAEEEYWGEAILKPPEVLRVDNLGDSGIDIKILGDTKPIRQWEVMGELRKRIKKAFDEEGIEIPWPHTKVYFGEALKQEVVERDISAKVPKRELVEKEPPRKVSRKKPRVKVLPPQKEEEEGEGDA